MGRIVGIDLGTTNSLVAITEHGVPRVLVDGEGFALLPSVVAYGPGGPRAVGREAVALSAAEPTSVVFSVKRLMGRAPKDIAQERAELPYRVVDDARVVRVEVYGRQVTPPEVSAEILKVLKRRAEAALGEAITEAVITVPAYFDDAQRQATLDAGRLAGLDVQRLVNEPTAASLAYGLQELQRGTIAVYDLGGGTFDISILKLNEGVFEVLATAGDTHLGGDDVDRAVAVAMAARVREAAGVDLLASTSEMSHLRRLAERVKLALSDAEKTVVEVPVPGREPLPLEFTRAQLEALAQALVERRCPPAPRAHRRGGARRRLDAHAAGARLCRGAFWAEAAVLAQP